LVGKAKECNSAALNGADSYRSHLQVAIHENGGYCGRVALKSSTGVLLAELDKMGATSWGKGHVKLVCCKLCLSFTGWGCYE
jgi:hypothetical protein